MTRLPSSNKGTVCSKTNTQLVGFEVLTAVSTKLAVFCVVAPCSLVEVYQRFRCPCCLHHRGDELQPDWFTDYTNWFLATFDIFRECLLALLLYRYNPLPWDIICACDRMAEAGQIHNWNKNNIKMRDPKTKVCEIIDRILSCNLHSTSCINNCLYVIFSALVGQRGWRYFEVMSNSCKYFYHYICFACNM
jgi:hypothetical protein